MAEGRTIELSTDVAANVADTIAALVALSEERHGNANGLYRRSSGAALVRPGADGQSLADVDVAALRVLVHEAALVQSWKPVKGGDPELRPCSYPIDLARATLSTLPAVPDLLRLPVLDAVAASPVLLPDGRLLGPGEYSGELGVLVSPDAPPVHLPVQLDHNTAGAAARRLTDLVEQFPWLGEADQAAWLALVLTIAGREIVAGPAPLLGVTGNVAGAGKGLLVDVAALITTGRTAPVLTPPGSPEEAAKALLAIAMGGQRLALLDNVTGALLGGPLDAALTAGYIQGRLLGQTRMVEAPWRAVVAATGNNLQVTGDLQRRIVPIRLKSDLERPELRDDLKIPDLLEHVRTHRLALLGDALTILAAWMRSGRPTSSLQAFGSFGAWSNTIRQAVRWVTGLDCCAHRLEWAAEADQGPSVVRVLLESWPVNLGQRLELTSSEMLLRLSIKAGHVATPWQEALLEMLPQKARINPTAAAIGYALKPWRDRTIAGLRLVRERGGANHVATWTVTGDQPQETRGNGTHRPPSPAPSPADLDGLPC